VNVARTEFRETDGIEEPLRFDGHQLLGGASDELLMSRVVEGRRLISFHPEPKEFVVRSHVDFRPS
jgi:hypothetical protein